MWADISGYEGFYQISHTGKVRSVRRITHLPDGRQRLRESRMLSLRRSRPTVDLWKDGKSKLFQVHRLVAEAFLPNLFNHPYVLHINGDRQNNHIDNLMWSASAKFPKTDLITVRDVYERMWEGNKLADISEDTGLSQGYLSLIKHGKAWNSATHHKACR